MGRQCCVLGCSSGIHLPFHSFPKNEIMANKWKTAVYSVKIKHLTEEQIKKCVVCYRHFADNDYDSIYRLRRLKPDVVPSLFLPDNDNNNDNSKADLTVENSKTEIVCTPAVNVSITEMKTAGYKQIMSKVPNITINLTNENSSKTGLSSPKDPTLYDKHMKCFHRFTPKMWKLYKIAYILTRKQEAVSRKQLSFRQRIRQANQYSKSPAIKKLLYLLTPTQRTFVQMQIKTKYSPKDRYFTLDEKIAALSIMKQFSKCYECLTQVFDLPSTHTLRSILQKINIHPGPINFINRRLKEQVKVMKQKDKLCLLMWDEILLQPHLDYDAKKKHIVGFEDFGGRRNARFADHAMVFMVRGIQNGWKFPLAYYLCDGATQIDQLAKSIKTISKIIIDSGLYLVAFVCKNGKRNLAAVNKLKFESARRKLRRGERCYEFDCAEREERKFASWRIIEQAYRMDLTHNVYRLMPKITMEHVIKSKMNIKKVKNVTQVLSMTMGGFIHHHTKLKGHVNTIYGPLKMPEKEGLDTAEMILFFDRLFDSVNGHTLKPEKPLRVAVSDNSPHLSFWQKAIKRLRRMRFVDPVDKKPLKESIVLRNWISTLQGFRKLWKILKKYKFKHFRPRILNQDSLVHFFGQIRSLGERNAKPTCSEFESSFKTLLLNNLKSRCIVGSNSENKTDGPLLFTLKEFIRCRAKHASNDDGLTQNLSDLETKTKLSDKIQNYDDICSSIARRIMRSSHVKECQICRNLISDPTKSELVPSERLLKTFEDADVILAQIMSNVCYLHHTALMLEIELYTLMDLHWLNCQQHHNVLKKLLISYMVVLFISKWCNGINDILTDDERVSLS
ncbi:PREDICTED: uncharacterized protein LOC106742071 isoform X2 [Dinoponera quadriceps]|uniref:Uncharacterized protein LOC106742071 isoform X2 n=1 Tax=Dinoponera quadriceps TaxID=609295 RepID=A0A6P3WX26_DINQU|nr:PREDICTED: uncharacterized protein LOC106742071 isoform X2 [Dinoponera quadriceps]